MIIYQSDHGHSTETRTFGGGGSAGPYRGAKFSLFEGGIRVPTMISWPSHLPEDEVRDQLGTGCDWLPTIAELCGARLPARKLDGKSLVPVIRSADADSPHRVFHWQLRDQWAVREGSWKLIGNPKDTSHKAPITKNDRRFLVNLEQDVTEMENIADKNAAIVKRLESLHDAWAKEIAGR
ncbi:MAG: sulfatase [Pirellulales bacterium]